MVRQFDGLEEYCGPHTASSVSYIIRLILILLSQLNNDFIKFISSSHICPEDNLVQFGLHNLFRYTHMLKYNNINR